MARNLHFDSNECDSFNYFQSIDSKSLDSLFEGLKKKPSAAKKSRSERGPSGTEKLRKAGKNLDELLNLLTKKESSDLGSMEESDAHFSRETRNDEISQEMDVRDVKPQDAETSPGLFQEQSETKEEFKPTLDDELPKTDVESEIFAPIALPVSDWHFSRQTILTLVEGGVGLLIGLGIIIVMMNYSNPVEKRLANEFGRTISGNVSYESSEWGSTPFTNSELTLKILEATAAPEDSSSDFSVQEMKMKLAAFPQIFRNIMLETTSMKGIVFPNLRTLEYQDVQRPAPIAPLFSDEIKNILAKQEESLESFRHLEVVKARHLPAYEEISGQVKSLNEEVTKIEEKLKDFPELQEAQGLTTELLKFTSDQHPELLPDLKRLGELRKESIDLQKKWMELNQTVAKDLAQTHEKIVLDGKAFSTILHYAAPTEQRLTEYLFQSTIEKRMAESLIWNKALSRVAEVGILPESHQPARKLKADGRIELFGQTFNFDSVWESGIEPENEVSYGGSLRLSSAEIPEEMLKDAFIAAGYSENTKFKLHKISARIPLVHDSFVLGDCAALPLYTRAQSSTLVLDLSLFNDEIHGKMNLEMNQVSFEAPRKDAELAGILYSQFEGKTFPKIVINADVSGKLNAPIVKCASSSSTEMLPLWSLALQKIHQHARQEIIASMYERLKNEETAFNGLLEPFYQEILACSEKTDLFRNFQMGPLHEAEVEIVPMDLAHLEVNQLDVTENIPTYNPNLGMDSPAPAVQEPIANPIGNQAQVTNSVVKSVPVKKVTEIEPIVPQKPQTSAAPTASTAPEVPAVPAVPTASTAPEVPAVPAVSATSTAPEVPAIPAVSAPVPTQPLTVIPSDFEKTTPNVADPVFYSNQSRSSEVPVDVPQNRKKSLPLPMGKSTSHFGT